MDTLTDIPFVGRDQELDQLQTRWSAVVQGIPAIVMIAGEAGIGKSRLACEFGDGLPLFIESRIPEQHSNPYVPITFIIGNLIGDTPVDKALEQRGINPDIFAPALSALIADSALNYQRDLSQHLLFEAINRLLQSVEMPTCLFIDDLHWADDIIFDLLHYLLTHLTSCPVLILCAYRSEESRQGRNGMAHPLRHFDTIPSDTITHLTLHCLNEQTVGDLAQSYDLIDVDLYKDTEGLPLFVAEYIKAHHQSDFNPSTSLPSQAQRIISHRLDRLTFEDRCILRCAALFGESIDPELIISVLGQSKAQVLTALERVREIHQLVAEDSHVYRLTHAKFRDQLKAELSANLKQAYYHAAAEYIEKSEGDIFILAFYYEQAQVWDRAAFYTAKTALRYRYQSAFGEAESYAQKSLEFLEATENPPVDKVIEVCIASGLSFVDADRARLCFERALQLSKDSLQRADLHYWLANAHSARTEMSQRIKHLEAARREIGSHTDSVQMARFLRMQTHGDDHRLALSGYLPALDLYERHAPNDPEIYEVYENTLVALSKLGDEQFDNYVSRFRRWIAKQADTILDLQFKISLASIYGELGRLHHQKIELEQALNFIQTLRQNDLQSKIHLKLATANARLGNKDQFEIHLNAYANLQQQLGSPLNCFGYLYWSLLAWFCDGPDYLLEFVDKALQVEHETATQHWDAITPYISYLGHIESALFKAGRQNEFAEYCKHFQQREIERDAYIHAEWWGEFTTVDDRWDDVDIAGFQDSVWFWNDPYEVCDYQTKKDSLSIAVNDILGFNKLTAPVLSVPIEGDFRIEVEVHSTQESQQSCAERIEDMRSDTFDRNQPMLGAGALIIYNDAKEAVRLIAHVECPGDIIFQTRHDDQTWLEGRALIPSGPVILRLERHDDLFKAFCRSKDGDWLSCGKTSLPLGWKISVGVSAEIPVDFYAFTQTAEARFKDFQIYRPRVSLEDYTLLENTMLRELHAVLKVDGTPDETRQRLLEAIGTSVNADRGALWKSDSTGWVEQARWPRSGELLPQPGLSDDGLTVVDGSQIHLSISNEVAVLVRQRPFHHHELEVLESTASIAGAILENLNFLRESKQRQIRQLVATVPPSSPFPNIIGQSQAMLKVFNDVQRAAQGVAPVLIQGESGSGKELIARAIHDSGPRTNKMFVAQNCAAIPDNLLESELFGYSKGGFTGAVSDKPGLLEVADGGTIFLDEIADASPIVQAKLLRAVEEGEIRRVGDTKNRKIDVRIISATSRNMVEQVERGKLREDLYYRLHVVRIALPPLRERRDDIPMLAETFLKKLSDKNKKQISGFTQGAMAALCNYPWPGNVRELQNEVERCVTMSAPGQAIDTEDLSSLVREISQEKQQVISNGGSLPRLIKHIETTVISQALERCGGNAKKAAQELGLSRSGLYKKMNRYGLDRS